MNPLRTIGGAYQASLSTTQLALNTTSRRALLLAAGYTTPPPMPMPRSQGKTTQKLRA
jgi:hypothetical protein